MYDLIIIGLGPAGINACIYAKRSNLNILVFEKNMPGGTLHTIKHVDNYLGYNNVDGTELAMLFYKQFKDLKVPMKNEEVIKVELNGNEKIVKTNNGTYKAKAVIIATGRGKQKLGLDNENINGVSTCAVCDGALYKDKTVAIYGNNPLMLEDILYLSNIVKKLYIITSKEKLLGNSELLDKVNKLENIELLFNQNIKKINGKDKIESIELNDKTLTIDGLFINNEYGPITSFVKELGITNEKGYIIADDNGKTKIDGIYVCGDSKEKTLYQIITAASEGALAATDAYKYIKNYK